MVLSLFGRKNKFNPSLFLIQIRVKGRDAGLWSLIPPKVRKDKRKKESKKALSSKPQETSLK